MPKQVFNHRQILTLAIPMMLCNISTPLLGLVDTAVMGHLHQAEDLAATSLGGLIFNFIFWAFGFLRMGATGMTAQAYGDNNYTEQIAILLRVILLAILFSSLIIILQQPIKLLSFNLLNSGAALENLTAIYFDIRILSAPATLCNYAILGWLLGVQDVKRPLIIVVFGNVSNIIFDFALVTYWHWGIAGVAYASLLAEYTALILGLILLKGKLPLLRLSCTKAQVFDLNKIKQLLLINQDIFIRTLCLIFAFAFFTSQGTKFGHPVLAANAVLLNFITLMSYALDGIAHAAEALVGRAIGAHQFKLFRQTLRTTFLWSLVIATVFSNFYFFTGIQLINLLTDLQEVRQHAYLYLPWVIIIPFLAFGCFLLDGIFIGAAWSKAMRNTMLFATFVCFLPTWYYSQYLHNQGLWLALSVFFLARTVSMGLVLRRKWKHIQKKSSSKELLFKSNQ